MKTEENLRDLLKDLKKEFKDKETLTWQSKIRNGGIETNEYYWLHCGERAYEIGKMSMIEEMIK